ncbi:unnamed protein product [Fraxinus pennsylvanica]|uniref:Uncharacterized protein n=1 Tax=Fraxinus pennsylvanica TaxID=56036 RepID=A0AAD2DSR7_9LAMI|nr:unnamed protein product [Fraxinus pennsylvanica]
MMADHIMDLGGTVPENYICLSYEINTVGIIRAPRGDGKEAIVLVTPYNSLKITRGEALSLGSAYALFSLFSRVTWLSKDFIWLSADSRHGEYTAVASWLRDYHTASFGDFMHSETCGGINLPELKTVHNGFQHAGTMVAARH